MGKAGLDGVADGALGDDLPGGDPLFHQFHNLDAGLFALGQPGGGNCRCRAAVRQGHAQRFRQGAHSIGRTQIGAGAAAGACGVLQGHIFRLP